MTTLACIGGGLDALGVLILSGIALAGLVGIPAVLIWLVGLILE